MTERHVIPSKPGDVDPNEVSSPRRDALAMLVWVRNELDEVIEAAQQDNRVDVYLEYLDVVHTALMGACTVRHAALKTGKLKSAESEWVERMSKRGSYEAPGVLVDLVSRLTSDARWRDRGPSLLARAYDRWSRKVQRGRDA